VNLVLLVNETGGDPFVEKNIFLASGLGIASIPLGFFFPFKWPPAALASCLNTDTDYRLLCLCPDLTLESDTCGYCMRTLPAAALASCIACTLKV
jgi:hypothetical protein